MKLLLTFALFACAMPSFAQNLNQDIRSLLGEIDQRVRYNQDQQTLLRVRERLRSTLDLLSGQNPGPGPGPTPNRLVVCIARDNDGRDPWVLGMKDPITLRQSALPSSNVGSLAICEQVKNNALVIQNSVFVCVPRDNDGRDPWTLAHYRNGALISKLNNVGSLDNCLRALNNAARTSQAVAFCATRDNDGRDPWIQMSVIAATGETHRGGSYGNLEQCLRSKIKLQLED